jgi:uncharacterized phosphosugar-binding protein
VKNAALEYQQKLISLCQQISETQKEPILQAAKIIAEKISGGGILFTYGTGHSFLVASEVVFRSGGLACVEVINEPSLTGNIQVVKSEFMERVEGMAEVTFNYFGLTSKDALIIISNSGRNAATIEMAMTAKKHQVPVIAITSLEYSKGTASRYAHGKKLYDVADVVIDNQCPKGDCVISLDGLAQPFGASSGVTGSFILHSIIVQTIANLVQMGIEPPVFRSGNLDGSSEFNNKLIDKYRSRVRAF